MGMVVRTNTMAQNAYRQLGVNNTAVGKSLEKLSSGFRINRAADDASGLAISEKMKAQIKGLEQASANSQDGISLIQTAEGATTEIHNMLNRMTELATKSANGTIQDDVDREAIQKEVDDLNAEITRISKSTNFNGINLLDGTLGKTGVTSGKGAASVGVDIMVNDALTGQAATKATDEFTVTGLMTASKDKDFSFVYKDDKGVEQTLNITIVGKGANTDNIQYKINDGAVMDSNVADSSNGVLTLALQGEVLTSALNSSDLGKLFTVTDGGSGDMTLEAKTAGVTQAHLVTAKAVDKNAPTAPLAFAVTNNAGTDQYSQLDVSKFTAYDGTDKTKDQIFTVNGKKFAFVAPGADTTKFSPDITTVKIQGGGTNPDNTVVSAMVDKINEAFGAGTATTVTGSTDIDFKSVAGGKTTGGQGLTLQVGDTNAEYNHVTVSVDDLSAQGIGTSGIDVSKQPAAGKAIEVIKQAINKVSTNRANLGSLQNRLEYTINNLDTTAENMTAANSRIRDTDMAKEMMNYTKMNILTQSAQAMLAQANQQPQAILQLLQ